eukprot:TRINITY_DN9564_c0_g1_i2.p1 TRINITY_DN9564_c0_g1~~TRINITY_DN9564_c0_g1_i2.p1  ORF type:complete len:381 (+),score=105.83 TRINITY_DN9564_c0_g1_i2:238-1380(+)
MGLLSKFLALLCVVSNLATGSLPPSVLGLGAQKAGSTTLFSYLQKFTWMQRPGSKELHYFDNPGADAPGATVFKYQRYASNWRHASSKLACNRTLPSCRLTQRHGFETIEFTPNYLSDRRVPARMQRILPHAASLKFIVILRDPVTRALSGYWQADATNMTLEVATQAALIELELLERVYNRTLNLTNASCKAGRCANAAAMPDGLQQYQQLNAALTEMVKTKLTDRLDKPWYMRQLSTLPAPDVPWGNVAGVVDTTKLRKIYQGHILRSIYVDQFRNYLCAGFRPEQFVILTITELKQDWVNALQRIAAFLDRPFELEDERVLTHSISGYHHEHPTWDDATRQRLQRFFKPYNKALLRLLMGNRFNLNPAYLLGEFDKY